MLDGISTVEHREWAIHWYARTGFEDLVTAAGLVTVDVLDGDGNPAGPQDTNVRYVLRATQ